MPYKEGVKLRSKVPVGASREKSKYKVTNWSSYNKSLKKCGQLSLLFPSGDIAEHFINKDSYCQGYIGRKAVYQPAYIELIYIHYRLFGWGMRQIRGYFEDLWSIRNLDIPVPSFGNLSDLFGNISLEVKQLCHHVKRRIENGEAVDLIADGGYYSIERNESLLYQGIMPIIPPPFHAVVHGKDKTSSHDKIVKYIQDKGTVYAFHKKYGYGVRSLVEALFSRIKKCLGSTLLTQRESSQNNEGIIIANIMNLWNSFGKCNSQKIG